MFVWNESAWFSFLGATACKSVAVLGIAWLVATLMRRHSAAKRHVVWTAAFAALMALPFLSQSLPAIRVPGVLAPSGVVFQATAVRGGLASPGQLRTVPVAATSSGFWRPDWRLWMMLVWATGVVTGFAQLIIGWAVISRTRRRSRPFNDVEVLKLAEALGIRDHVAMLGTPHNSMPMTFGLLQPTVFIPADAANWSQERRRLVLLHELAHVRRGDIATNLLARTALVLYWWNPLAWSAWREFLKERERAADDLVLRAGARASEYAGHLLEIARTMQSPAAIHCAGIAMARKSQLEGRLLVILDSTRNRKTAGRTSAWIAALLTAAVVVPLAALHAQDSAATAIPADVDATIRAAKAQKNHEMLDKAAEAEERLLKYDVAQKLLESSLAIRGEVSGQQSEEYATGLLQLGDVESKLGHLSEAEASYSKAVSLLGNRPEAARALIHLGTNAMTKKDLDGAFEYFQKAQLAEPAKSGTPLMWMAVVRKNQKNAEEAESLFKQALAVEEANSTEAATTSELYAQFLEQQGRTEEGKSLRNQASAMWKEQGTKATPMRPADNSVVFRVGKGVAAPMVLTKVDPEYTEEARLAKYQGTVVVSAVIGTDGMAYNMKAIRGLGLGLDEKAIEAISQWKFKPGTKDGQAVSVQATIEVNFRLL